jgi:hypothetical protein
MEAVGKRKMIGVLASAVALIALVAALAPGAQASGGFTSCANKQVKFFIEAEEGKKSPYTVTVKTISVKNVTCAAAYEFFRFSYNGEKTGKYGYPLDYKCKGGEFDTPLGYLPTVCTKGGKTIKYAQQGG